jgi:hypothetical protein
MVRSPGTLQAVDHSVTEVTYVLVTLADRENLYNISSECLFAVDRQGDSYAFHAVG